MLIWMLMFVGLALLALVAFLAVRSRPGRPLGDELGDETHHR